GRLAVVLGPALMLLDLAEQLVVRLCFSPLQQGLLETHVGPGVVRAAPDLEVGVGVRVSARNRGRRGSFGLRRRSELGESLRRISGRAGGSATEGSPSPPVAPRADRPEK